MFTFTKKNFSPSLPSFGSQIRCAQNWYTAVQTELKYPLVKVWYLQRHPKTNMQQKNKYQCDTATKHIQGNHFIDAILKSAMITLQQQSLLPLYQKLASNLKIIWKNSKHEKEYHFGNTEIDIEVHSFFNKNNFIRAKALILIKKLRTS